MVRTKLWASLDGGRIKMENIEGLNFDKFIIIKKEDIEKYLNASKRVALFIAIDDIAEGRRHDDKSDNNTYLVVNTDEDYVDEVIDILKRNGHWE